MDHKEHVVIYVYRTFHRAEQGFKIEARLEWTIAQLCDEIKAMLKFKQNQKVYLYNKYTGKYTGFPYDKKLLHLRFKDTMSFVARHEKPWQSEEQKEAEKGKGADSSSSQGLDEVLTVTKKIKPNQESPTIALSLDESEVATNKPVKGEKDAKENCAKYINPPKRPSTAYFLFSNDVRPEVKKSLPDLTFGDVSKELGRRWRAVSSETRTKYEALADKDKVRYIEDVEAYERKKSEHKADKEKQSEAKGEDEESPTITLSLKSNVATNKPVKKEKGTKDADAPKRPLSAFVFFSNDERPKVQENLQDVTFGGVSKELGKRWKAVSGETRAKYEALAAKDKVRYIEDVNAYKKKKLDEAGKEEEPGAKEDDD